MWFKTFRIKQNYDKIGVFCFFVTFAILILNDNLKWSGWLNCAVGPNEYVLQKISFLKFQNKLQVHKYKYRGVCKMWSSIILKGYFKKVNKWKCLRFQVSPLESFLALLVLTYTRDGKVIRYYWTIFFSLMFQIWIKKSKIKKGWDCKDDLKIFKNQDLKVKWSFLLRI